MPSTSIAPVALPSGFVRVQVALDITLRYEALACLEAALGQLRDAIREMPRLCGEDLFQVIFAVRAMGAVARAQDLDSADAFEYSARALEEVYGARKELTEEERILFMQSIDVLREGYGSALEMESLS